MPQTFYIENDEEIISVIGRLRRSSVGENYFIFPKRSLVLQSIINLKLFQREAEKLGKKVIIVTQDETGLTLAQKVGLATERYTDDFSRKTSHLELVAPVEKEAVVTSVEPETPPSNHTSEELGSNDFYTSSPQDVPSVAAGPEKILRVRNASPPKQTSLNSKRDTSNLMPKSVPTQSVIRREGSVRTEESSRPDRGLVQGGREERLKNFFSPEKKDSSLQERAPKTERKEETPKIAVTSKKARGIFLFLGSVSFLSLIGVLLFIFLPSAEIHVVPYKTTQSVDLQFEGRFEGVLAEDDMLPMRMAEREQEVIFSVEATGESLGTAQKARGTVVIYNKFSTEPQSLVATTRLESPEGKIFRLIEGVTVPGMTDGQPGAIEASVIADQSGTAYNITGTTFTIPGFKGSSKYEKFSAQSNKSLSGGSDTTGTDSKVISKDDLEKANELAKEKAKESFLTSVKQELAAGERVLEENIDVTSLGSATLPLSGTTATSFEYKNTFKVRGFLFSEESIREKIRTKGEETVNGVLFRPTAVTLSYGEAIPDYEGKKVRFRVHAVVDSESVIDKEKILDGLLGKNGDEVNDALLSFPEIKKLQIIFKPQWFVSTVPSSRNRVTVLQEPGSAE